MAQFKKKQATCEMFMDLRKFVKVDARQKLDSVS